MNGPITVGDGTGAYAGITGTVAITVTFGHRAKDRQWMQSGQ